MITLYYCINRLPQLSLEEFQSYWLDTHGPIAARIAGVRRYVQNHALSPAGPPPFDGVTQLYWDSLEDFRGAKGTPEVKAALKDDRNFIDLTRMSVFLAEPRLEFDRSPEVEGIKAIWLLKRRQGLSDSEFDRLWTAMRAPLADRVPQAVRHVRSRTVGGVEGLPVEFDGVAELWFKSADAMNEVFMSPGGYAMLGGGADYVDLASSRFLMAAEKVVVS
ncbi:MAG: EthD family reductase [Dehalococcoidia bacterium]|nr:EthD family reductase [Dehalococcoidia bacterium]